MKPLAFDTWFNATGFCCIRWVCAFLLVALSMPAMSSTAPTTATGAASLIGGTTAQLNGSANPNGDATTGWFRYATVNPGACNDSFGTRAPAVGGSSLGSGTAAVGYSESISGLTPGTTYYFCAIARNSIGISFGSIMAFTTPLPPTVTTSGASSLTNTSAYLNGTGNPNGALTTGYFRYSSTDPGSCNDSFGTRIPTSGGTSLGSGSAPVAFFEQVFGLSAGTTYYYCAIAINSIGTGFGSVMSFKTADAPSTSTTAATSVSSSSATLNGSVNPNGSAAYGYFRYSTMNPGSCNDTFGTRAPTSSGSDTNLGSGTSPIDYSRPISGLVAGTTYYYCALARNTYGTTFGIIMSFTTEAIAPTVTSNAATALGGTTAQLNGSANPHGSLTTGWFRYAAASPGACNDSFGTRAPVAGGSSLGSGTSTVGYSQGISGLSAGTTYYFCAIAQNSIGISFGSVLTFTTPLPPTVTTNAATSVTNITAYLNGAATPNGSSTTGYFRYSPTDPGSCSDAFGTRAPAAGGYSLGSGSSQVAYSELITGLSAGTTYYYCAIAINSVGMGLGSIQSFTTDTAPSTNTSAATSVTSSSVTLNGSANPNGDDAFGYFRYSATNPGTCDDLFGTRAPISSSSDTYLGSGNSPTEYSRSITGLSAGTTYYYCALARNTYGTSFGIVLSFTTQATAPTVNTNSASSVTGTTAQLNGSANPNGSLTTGWFRYSTASPGTCNDSFGTRAPISGGTSLGSGTAAVPYVESISGLVSGTTYYFCAIAQNSIGTSFGTVLSFVTLKPTTTTITDHGINPSDILLPIPISYQVLAAAGTPTGSVTVSDGTDQCTGTVAEGVCALTPTTDGNKTLIATYSGDSNFESSVSPGVAHQVDPLADISLVLSDSQDPVPFGSQYSYQVDVANSGPSQAQGVVVSVAIPTELNYASTSGGGFWTCDYAAGAVDCSLNSTLAIGSASPLLIYVVDSLTSPPAAPFAIQVSGSAASGTPDADDANNSAIETTLIGAEDPSCSGTQAIVSAVISDRMLCVGDVSGVIQNGAQVTLPEGELYLRAPYTQIPGNFNVEQGAVLSVGAQ